MPTNELPGLREQRRPYDGPHDPDTVVNAAEGLRELIRYLNNATGPGNAATVLPYAPVADRVLWNLTTALGGLDQLLRQLAAALHQHATQPSLYDDRRDRLGADTACQAVAGIQDARDAAGVLAADLDRVCALTSHLGHDLDI